MCNVCFLFVDLMYVMCCHSTALTIESKLLTARMTCAQIKPLQPQRMTFMLPEPDVDPMKGNIFPMIQNTLGSSFAVDTTRCIMGMLHSWTM